MKYITFVLAAALALNSGIFAQETPGSQVPQTRALEKVATWHLGKGL